MPDNLLARARHHAEAAADVIGRDPMRASAHAQLALTFERLAAAQPVTVDHHVTVPENAYVSPVTEADFNPHSPYPLGDGSVRLHQGWYDVIRLHDLRAGGALLVRPSNANDGAAAWAPVIHLEPEATQHLDPALSKAFIEIRYTDVPF